MGTASAPGVGVGVDRVILGILKNSVTKSAHEVSGGRKRSDLSAIQNLIHSDTICASMISLGLPGVSIRKTPTVSLLNSCTGLLRCAQGRGPGCREAEERKHGPKCCCSICHLTISPPPTSPPTRNHPAQYVQFCCMLSSFCVCPNSENNVYQFKIIKFKRNQNAFLCTAKQQWATDLDSVHDKQQCTYFGAVYQDAFCAGQP